METFPKSIVLTGEQVCRCTLWTLRDAFDEDAYNALYQRFDQNGYSPPRTWDHVREVDRTIRKMLRVHWTKRRAWMRGIVEPFRFDVFARVWMAALAAKVDTSYRVSVRWVPSLVKAMMGGGWTVAKTGSRPPTWLSNLRYTRGYIEWIERGGNEELGRWLVACLETPVEGDEPTSD